MALCYYAYLTIGLMVETLKLNEALSPEFFCSLPTFHQNGSCMYRLTQDNNLLLDEPQTKAHYQDGYESGFRMTIKEHPEGMTNNEFSEVCKLMKDFQTKK